MLRAVLTCREDWNRLHGETQPRRDVEQLMAVEYRDRETWHLLGWCDVCDRASRFECDWKYSNGKVPNYRERLVCEGCALTCRQRLVVRRVREVLGDKSEREARRTLYVYEQVTPLFRVLGERLQTVEVVGSEYLGHDVEPGAHRDGIRHEDALRLTFPDERFDVVLSNDVYEHVPDIELTLREAWRVLRPGGSMIATLPFWFGPETQQRARLVGGQVEHLAPPEYHPNPVSEQGSLVFYAFGWDLLEMCRRAGFRDAHFECTHSFFHCYLGAAIGILLHAVKAP